jgi:hypothetical protein
MLFSPYKRLASFYTRSKPRRGEAVDSGVLTAPGAKKAAGLLHTVANRPPALGLQ